MIFGLVCFIFYVHANTITAIKTVGPRFKSTPINVTRFTAPGPPWWSPIQPRSTCNVNDKIEEA